MNQEILSKFLEAMGEALKEAKDFSLEQLPIIAKEILSYHLATSILGTVICGGLIVLSLILIKKTHSLVTEQGWDEMTYLWSFTLMILTSIGFFGNLTEVLKIYLAPRVYLLEYIAHLLHVK